MTPTLEEYAARTLKRIQEIPDPEVRLAALGVLMDKLDGVSEVTRNHRIELVDELRGTGVTWQRLADLSHLSVVYLRRKLSVDVRRSR